MEFTVLGPVRACAGGRPLPLGGPKPQALLAALLTQPGQPVPTERLADAVWGSELPTSARGLVHTYVSGLRRALSVPRPDGHAVTRADGGYRLDVAPEHVDLWRFETLVDRARTHVASGEASTARDCYDRALDLWEGPPFGGHGNGFLQPEAHRLEELRLAALEERITADLSLGKDASLVPELRCLVHEHPLRERLWGSLMIALSRQGRRAEALQAFQRADEALRSTVGVEAGRHLQAIRRAVLADAPAPAG